MTPGLTAFLDESRKPIRDPATTRVDPERNFYVVAAAVVLDGDSHNTRRQLGLIRAEIGVQPHYRNLGKTRRVETLEAIDRISGWDGYLFETARPLPDPSLQPKNESCGVRRLSNYPLLGLRSNRRTPCTGFSSTLLGAFRGDRGPTLCQASEDSRSTTGGIEPLPRPSEVGPAHRSPTVLAADQLAQCDELTSVAAAHR